MTTYTIVSKDTDPLGPNEINADDTIYVSDGDVFIIDPSADSDITFQASGGGPAEFEIQINGSNANGPKITVEENLTPNITIGNDVDVADTDLDLKDTDAATLTAGDNVSLGDYDGSESGPNTIVIGDGFTTDADWSFGDAADSLTIGNNATFKNLDAGEGNDTITFGDDATIHDFDTKSGNDSVSFGDDLDANNLKTSDGNDTITIGDNAQVNVDGGSGNDTIYTDAPGMEEKNIESSPGYCYTPGTLIDTPDGPRPVESLEPGDLITTIDHGLSLPQRSGPPL